MGGARGAARRAVLFGSVLAALTAVGCGSAPAPKAMTAEQKVARGKQIAYTSACHDCHTPGGLYGAPDTMRTLSGSELGWEGPWGVSFPRNLTPDMETGIGSWSEDDIVTAIRTGVRPDHTPLMPPMPWPMYSHMSDEDAHALAAYLKSLPPVRHKAPERIAPGAPVTVAHVTIPAPPAWDAQHLPPPTP